MDNSLHTLMMLFLVAIRKGLSLPYIMLKTRIHVYGDDMLIVEEGDVFDFLSVSSVWTSFGGQIEGNENVPFWEAEYLGTTPKPRQIYGHFFVLYSYSPEKLFASANYFRKKMQEIDRLKKLVVLASLLYGDEVAFDKMRNVAYDYSTKCLGEEATKTLTLLSSDFLNRLYLNRESLEERWGFVQSFFPTELGIAPAPRIRKYPG